MQKNKMSGSWGKGSLIKKGNAGKEMVENVECISSPFLSFLWGYENVVQKGVY